jgi:TrmH family RNA methyltransferase
VALVFGSEAHGLPPEVLDACDVVARVPMLTAPRSGFSGVAESLNLAATVAVLAFEAARQRRMTNQGL